MESYQITDYDWNIFEKTYVTVKKSDLIKVDSILYPTISTYIDKNDQDEWINIYNKLRAKLYEFALSNNLNKLKPNELEDKIYGTLFSCECETEPKKIIYYEFTNVAISKHTLYYQ